MARILVIDDDELVRNTIRLMLEQGGHKTLLARDGRDGIRQFQTVVVDLVICDVFMPDKEGLETISELCAIRDSMPIISMTGGLPQATDADRRNDPDFLPMTCMLGATHSIAKPFKAQELLAVVRQCLDSSEPTG